MTVLPTVDNLRIDAPMQLTILKRHPDAVLPAYQTPGAAAFDLAIVEGVVIGARSIAKVRTGLVIQTPPGHVLVLASRSSNPMKKGIDLANSIGVIDSDYRGPEDEILLLLANVTDGEVRLSKGDRVAQGMILPVVRPEIVEIDHIDETNRGGFGTTGT